MIASSRNCTTAGRPRRCRVVVNRAWQAIILLLAAASAPSSLLAQEYPSKAIRWVVPYPTGGTSDFLARLIGLKLTEAWKQSVVVENRGGAGGNIGTEVVAKAAADGYTMLLVASTITMNQALYSNLSFDAEKDFTPVTSILWQPYALAVHPSLPVSSVKQLLALARAKPGALDYSSGGNGNASQIAAVLFGSAAGVQLRHIPYRGMGPAILALLQGEVQITFASLVAVEPHLRSGRIRVIGVTGRERVASLPQVPTVSEAGVPGYVEGNWQGVMFPAGTPQPIVAKVNQELVRILRTPEIRDPIARVGADVIANTPDQFAAMIRTDVKRYADLIKAHGIKAD